MIVSKEPNDAIIGAYGSIYSYQMSLVAKYHPYLNFQVEESTIKTHTLHTNLNKIYKEYMHAHNLHQKIFDLEKEQYSHYLQS